MAALRQIAVTILRVWPLLLLSSGIAACRFEYRKQPPSTTLSDCSPYQDVTNIIVINLECVVRKDSRVTNEYEIRWYRENTTGGVEDLGRGDPDVLVASGWLSRYHETKLLNQHYNPSFVGKYWCQVINTTADPDQPLMRSNVFTLLPPDSYTRSTCSGTMRIQHINNETCADLPEPDHSKTPIPSTTTFTRAPTSTTDLRTTHSTTNHHHCCDHTRTVTANHSTHTPAVTSSPTATLVMAVLPPSSVQQTIVFVLVPVVCVVLTILIILVVLILIVLRKKKTTRQTDLKEGVGINNNTYEMSLSMSGHEVLYHNNSPSMEENAKPLQTLKQDNEEMLNSGYAYCTSIYTDVNSPTQDGSRSTRSVHCYSGVDKEPALEIPPADNYSRLQHDTTSQLTSSVYSKLDHSQPLDLDDSLQVNELYSSLEESWDTPLYNRLRTTSNTSHAHPPTNDDPSYYNIVGNCTSIHEEELHSHCAGSYERSPGYISPTLPTVCEAGGEYYSGDYERDPNYQISAAKLPTTNASSHQYCALRRSTQELPPEYEIVSCSSH